MNADLRLIWDLQSVDTRIAELKREIARLPKHVAEIERKLESHKQALAADQAALEENRKDRRLMESEIVGFEQKLSHIRVQMGEAKTNEVFRAFQKEIKFVEDGISKLEDRILDKMIEAETIEQNVAKAEQALKIESEAVAKEITETKVRVAKDEEELVLTQKNRAALASSIAPDVLKIYERVRKLRGNAVAEVSNDCCLVCHVVMRPHMSQRLRQEEEILTCESCGRILYYPPLDSPPVEDPAREKDLAAS